MENETFGEGTDFISEEVDDNNDYSGDDYGDNERDLYAVLVQEEEIFWLNADGTWGKDTLATPEIAKAISKIYNAEAKKE